LVTSGSLLDPPAILTDPPPPTRICRYAGPPSRIDHILINAHTLTILRLSSSHTLDPHLPDGSPVSDHAAVTLTLSFSTTPSSPISASPTAHWNRSSVRHWTRLTGAVDWSSLPA
jgi:hypothetical protein